MAEKKFYSVSELSEVVGVARTTLNDWLNRYNDYLESELRGKRRVYGEHTVTVLKEVADLRESGKSAFEIDQELATRHPINPEVAQMPEPQSPPPERCDSDDAESTLPAVAGANQELPQAMQATEAALRFADELRNVIDVLQKQQQETEALLTASRSKVRKMIWTSAIGFVLLAAVVAAGFLWLSRYSARQTDQVKSQMNEQFASAKEEWDTQNRKISAEAATRETRIAQESAAQRKADQELADAREAKLTQELSRQRESEAAQRLEILKALEVQKKAFDEKVTTLGKELDSRSQAELKQLREEFARRQQEYLTELNALKQVNAELSDAAQRAASAAEAAQKAQPTPEKPAENLQNDTNGVILQP